MGSSKDQGSGGVFVTSEIISEEEHDRRRSQFLSVAHRKASDDDADIFVVTAEIAAAAEDIFALVDWADPRNSKRQLGEEVVALDDSGRRFRLVIDFMRDVQFDNEVLRAEKPAVYQYECLIIPPQGHLGRTVEMYEIEPLHDGKCSVTMTITAYFDVGLSPATQAETIHMMTVGAHNGLAKIKAYAEHGVGTMEAFHNLQLMPL
jgi:hypothetical protein